MEIIKSTKVYKNNTSGVKGVSRNRGLWMVKISFARKQFFLGRYRNFAQAVEIYREAETIRNEVLEEIGELQENAVRIFAARLLELREPQVCDRQRQWQ